METTKDNDKKKKIHKHWPTKKGTDMVSFWWNGVGTKDADPSANKKYTMTVNEADKFLSEEYLKLKGKVLRDPQAKEDGEDN